MKNSTLLHNGSSSKEAGDRPAPKPVTTLTPRADCLSCAGTCGQDCAPDRAHPGIRTTQVRMVPLNKVMGYQFEPLIHRMVDKHSWPEWLAREVFEDYKRYAWLCVTSGQSIAPTPVIDDMWHNHILFTADYAKFCRTVLGRFLHHRPNRRGEKSQHGSGETPVQLTTRLATEAFGKLSKHWEFHGLKTCENDCGPK
ncbi:MAG: hypothetical protein V4481_04375 [Patescibacteria group bacterium]